MGNLYVADRNLHRMQKFTGEGSFVTKWGSFGTGEGQFTRPYALRAGANGLVFVADSGNHRIQKFRFPAVAVPALSECGLLLMGILLAVSGSLLLRSRATRL